MTRATRAALLALVSFATAGGAVGQEGTPASAATPDPRTILGAPRGRPLAGAALDAATQEIAALLRCPVCQGLSVADSPTDLARNMKQQVRALLAAGYDREQVLGYFEWSYGEFVRLQPPLRGVNWLVWVAPVVGLLAGGFIVARSLRRGREAPDAEPTAEAGATDEEDADLAPYLLRVRELAYGWPGGHPPQPPASAGKA
jgi:cytochrome c-type biogenesis protein CcmH